MIKENVGDYNLRMRNIVAIPSATFNINNSTHFKKFKAFQISFIYPLKQFYFKINF